MTTPSEPQSSLPVRGELTRTTFGVIVLVALSICSLWILRPFLAAGIWATMIVVTTWPVLLWLEAHLWKRRSLAVLVMTMLLLLLLIVPLMLLVGTIIQNSDTLVAHAKALASFQVPPPPDWLGKLPFVGERAAQAWQDAVSAGVQGLIEVLAPYADDIARWLVAKAGNVGFLFVEFLLVVVLSAVMYSGGESAARAVRQFARRLAGDQGENAVTLGGQAISGVALGVGVTAVVQAGLGGIGLAIVGVPFAGPLTAVMVMLCIAQIGAGPVLIPAVVWMYWSGQSGWGTFLLVWSIVVLMLDNVLRPWLIRRGADLPLLLIFAGVIGGLLSFGLVGVFIGPVVLAVAYTLLDAWIHGESPPHDAAG